MNDLKYEWDSSVPRVQEQVDRLCVHPQPPDPVPPPGLAGASGWDAGHGCSNGCSGHSGRG